MPYTYTNTMKAKPTERVLLIDSAAGIYVPKRFATNFAMDAWGVSQEDADILSDPDHDEYWDVWTEVLDHAHHTDEDGALWHLHHDDGDGDGGLFAVPEGYKYPED